jgi:hypothetical protein
MQSIFDRAGINGRTIVKKEFSLTQPQRLVALFIHLCRRLGKLYSFGIPHQVFGRFDGSSEDILTRAV